jgi:16S rRNA (guanine966-N2)-methyltransferase
LDLFAGSGQMGLEALSRGASGAVFVENGKKAAKCIEENIAFTKFTDRSRLMVMDAASSIAMLEGKYRFDIIFMDPPYNKGLEMEVLQALKSSSIVKEDTTIIVEASLETDFSRAEELGYEMLKYKKYKTNAHVFLRRK